MATRRLVDAVDDLRAEIRLANQIAALGLGVAALKDEDVNASKVPVVRERMVTRNALKADVRRALGMED